MSTLERVWIVYCATVTVVALCFDGGGHHGHGPMAFAAVHAAIAVLQLVPAWGEGRWRPATVRVVRGVLAVGGLPVVFSSMAWLLPHVHPEPWEMLWYRADVAAFGRDSTEVLRAALPGAAVVLLQIVYAVFYFVPIVAAALVGLRRGGAAYDRAVTILVASFLCSYALYLWFPTLAPKVVLPVDAPPVDGFTGWLRELIDTAEANPWDCFPSGHTMLSLISTALVWRWARPWTGPMLLVVVPLVASTMLLRYHWPIDVLAGALLAWPCLALCDRLLDLDGAPPARSAGPGAPTTLAT